MHMDRESGKERDHFKVVATNWTCSKILSHTKWEMLTQSRPSFFKNTLEYHSSNLFVPMYVSLIN
jgi:hypothetical protein